MGPGIATSKWTLRRSNWRTSKRSGRHSKSATLIALTAISLAVTGSSYALVATGSGLIAIRYDSFDSKKILSDVEAFAKKQGIEKSASVSGLRIIGSYDPANEKTDKGIERALQFSAKLSALNSDWFKYASTTVQSAADANVNNVVVEYTFSQLVQVLPSS